MDDKEKNFFEKIILQLKLDINKEISELNEMLSREISEVNTQLAVHNQRGDTIEQAIKDLPCKEAHNYIHKVEKDLSAASYWVIFALINACKVILPGITLPSLQGDSRIFDLAEQVGAEIMLFHDRVEIIGKIKTGLTADCFDIPDLVPALSVLALFAPEPFKLMNVTHLQYKESNRIQAIQHNISGLGGKSEFRDEHLTVYPQKNYQGGVMKSFNDHRIIMSFAMAGTKIANTFIEDPSPVNKSYPAFWNHFTFWEKVPNEK